MNNRILLIALFFLSAFVQSSGAFPSRLGDMDEDGVPTIFDIFAVIDHINGTRRFSAEAAVFADINQDGFVDDRDVDLLADAVLEIRELPAVPLTRILDTSPVNGAGNVAVTRETVLRFTKPLASDSLVTPGNFWAEAAGQRLVTRIELSTDRRTLTLFYTYPLPGSARVRVTFIGTAFRDLLGFPIDADGDGAPGGIGTIEFSTLSQTALPRTKVFGRVFASQLATNTSGTNLSINTCLAGITITADGLEETVRAVTDEHGNFALTNAPAGRFFVHIDGRTVTNLALGIRWPDLNYYPFVGKEWESIPFGETNIGEVYLPLVAGGTLVSVSQTNEIVIGFPDGVVAANSNLAGVSITVPANALFSDNGSRGGRVGIAPVPPDRLPGPLPTGLNLPIVITVQTDGPQNFDRPVPVCFPNLPGTNGVPLAPGAKAGLFSYNHDTGQWEIVGSMTVSADGKTVCSDPGVGILAPGWHGVCGDCTQCPTCPDSPPPPFDDDCRNPDPCKDGCPPFTCCDLSHCPKQSNPVMPYSGEKVEHATDLRIKGVGLDFIWQRNYGSKVPAAGPQGYGWVPSYDIAVQPSGSGVRLRTGTYRNELYRPAPGRSNTFCRLGFFDEVVRNDDASYTMTTPDQKLIQFLPCDGSACGGKVSSIADRHGNTMRFQYDAVGRLTNVIDTLARPIRIAYNDDGFIDSVTDFAGRSVRYTYYRDFEEGGSAGDLKSVTSTAVTGTPNGNDFPDGKTTVYTYSKGFQDERLNHNLLTITDGKGQTYLRNVYHPNSDPKDPLFDHVVTQYRGGDRIDFTYIFMPEPGSIPMGQPVQRVIIRDREGNVTEHFYDAGNREIIMREYTGRSSPDQPVTDTLNRPTGKLRPTDPDFFETRYEYNSDWKRTRTVHPNGNITEEVYESEMAANVAPRYRGNLRAVRHLPGTHQPAGDQPVITELMEYDQGFGCGSCGFNFVTKRTDGRGNFELMRYDAFGNLTNRIHSLSNIVEDFEYNERGQMTLHVHPANDSGYRRVDRMTYYEDGPMRGYLKEEIVDFGGLNLTTTYEYDLVGNVTKKTDPRGHDMQYAVNQLDQVVRETSVEVMDGSGVRYIRDYHYDANNNLVRLEIPNRRELLLEGGTPFQSQLSAQLGYPAADGGVVPANPIWTTTLEYEILNNVIRKSEEVEPGRFIVTEFGYDRNRQRTLTRYGEATAGRQTNNVTRILYDERMLAFQETRGFGETNQSTTQFDYDGNQNRVSMAHGLEDHPHRTLYVYDGYNRLVSMLDAMGNVTTNNFDASGNRTRTAVFGELNDVPGGAANVRLSETLFYYDAKNRLTNQSIAFFNATNQVPILDGWATTETIYTDNSQVFALINDNGHGRTNRYDTANRLHQVIDAKGNTTTFDYDGSGNMVRMTELEKSDLAGMPPTPFPGTGTNGSVIPYVPQPAQLGLDETFVTTYAYDNLNRLIATTDGSGNVNRSGYDSRNNRTLTVDALTNVIHITFDGLNRQLDTIREMVDRVGVQPLKPIIITRQVWDASGRLVQQIDDNTNATTYVFDSLNRKFATIYADFTGQTNVLDAHGSAILFTDANGNILTNRYDDLDRLVRRDVKVGPGVSDDTTWEDYRYDGLSRLTYAADNDSIVVRNYDSLGRVRQDIQGTNFVGAVYDGVGNQTELRYPSGRFVVTTYDQLERKKRISDRVALTGDSLIAEYWYTGPHRVARRNYGNQTATDFSYDGAVESGNSTADYGFKEITRIRVYRASNYEIIEDLILTWDKESNKTLRFRSGVTNIYAYDSANRLIQTESATSNGGKATLKYVFDGVGNRRETSTTTSNESNLYDLSFVNFDKANNQYSQTPYDRRTYDKNGNVLTATSAETGRATVYNYRNQLVSATVPDAQVQFAYDGLGRRMSKNGSSFLFLLHDEIEERIGSQIKSYVFGLDVDEILSADLPSGRVFYHSDDQLSIIAITGFDGEIHERVSYDDFGTPIFYSPDLQIIPSSRLGNSILYAGRRYDLEIALYYNRSRYLEPIIGRFLQRDTIGIWVDSLALGNGYTYVANNPFKFQDPFGLGPSGGPYHPPPGVGLRCYESDQCPTLAGKMAVLARMIASHTGWDQHMPWPRGGGRHSEEIAGLWAAYARCQSIYLAKCKEEERETKIPIEKECETCKPKSQEEINKALAVAAGVAGAAIIIIDIITVPSGEGACGYMLIRYAARAF